MTPSASPTSGVEVPESTSRELVDFLLEEGEQTALQDVVAIETEDLVNLDECVTGWGCSISLPKPVTKRATIHQPATKKGSKSSYPADIDMANVRVRCVSDDYSGDHHRSPWKANVEPGTYRYISNNGIYRASKFASTGSDWVTVKRSRHSEANAVALEVRQAQKTLKKELTNMFRNTGTAKSEPSNTEYPLVKPEAKPPVSSSSAVTISEAVERPTTQNTFKDPKLVKSASDLFVEKFSTRMDALQKSEIERHVSSAPRTPLTPSKQGGSSSKRPENPCPDSAPQAVDDIAKDVFTVKSVPKISAEQPLRPLEKLTPQQRSIDRGSASECSSHNSRSEAESPLLPTSFMNAMNAFAQLHHQHYRGKDIKNKSGPPSYRGHHKNSLGNVSATSTLSDNDSLSSVRNALTMTNSSIERMRMRPYGRKSASTEYAVKDYGKFLTGNYRLGAPSATSKKPPHVAIQRKGIVGYKPTLTHTTSVAMDTAVPSRLAPSIHPVAVGAAEDLSGNVSDTSESYLSGTSMSVQMGSGSGREARSGNMALPEISGKRLPVTTSTQRML